MNTITMKHAAIRHGTKTTSLSRWFHKLAVRLREYLQRRKQQRINRDAFAHLLSLDEHILNDMGVTRNDVVEASKLPLSVNAAVELRRNSSLR